MAKQEGKGVNIKSMTVLVIIILVVLSAVFSGTYYGASWWLEEELAGQYQPKYNGKLLAAKLLEFNQKNNRFPDNSPELLSYLNVKNPVFVSPQGAFRLKNYAYVYRQIDKKMIVLWAIPSPKDALIAPTDTEKFEEIKAVRTRLAQESVSYFTIITPKQARQFQGVLTETLTDIDLLPDQPTPNQLNSIGLFEKRR
jgi:hypothetical protein